MSDLRTISLARVLLGTVALAAAAPASAAPPDTTQMTIQARVPGVCRIENPTVMDFGDVDNVGGADSETAATVDWRCTNGTSATITIDNGTNGTRQMASPSAGTDLPYELYRDAARTNRWGDDAATGVSVLGSGMSSPASLDVFGRVDFTDAEAADPADDYSDVVTISITW